MFDRFKKKSPGPVDYMIVGLGNPGKHYDDTRHNCGYIAVGYIAYQLKCRIDKLKFKSTMGMCEIEGKKCLLLKPTTFMNNSGEAVREAMNFYKLRPEQVIVIFDDVSLNTGMIRIKRKGSDGGQKGMANIIYLTGSDNFPRIKIGIGPKPHPDYDLKDFVLSRFTKDEQKNIESVLPKVYDSVKHIVNDDIDQAMNLYN